MSTLVTTNHPSETNKPRLKDLPYGTIIIHAGHKCILSYHSPDIRQLVSLESPNCTWTLNQDVEPLKVLGLPKKIHLEF